MDVAFLCCLLSHVPSICSVDLPSRNTALCTASSPLSLSSGKMDHVIPEPGQAAIVWDITGQVQRACALAEPELCRRTALTASYNFIVKHHCKPCHGLSLPQVPNCWSHGNTLGFQLSVCLEEVVDFYGYKPENMIKRSQGSSRSNTMLALKPRSCQRLRLSLQDNLL